MSIKKNNDSKYTLLYYENVDIDGIRTCSDFAKLVQESGRKKQYQRAHEWCCGHGAVGFKLLELDICNSLVLTDVYPLATVGCEFSTVLNDLQDRVTVYNASSLGDLPQSEKWDLFVANPPWRSEIKPGPELSEDMERKMFDVDWKIHNNMWLNISKYLTSDADIYLYEDIRFSNQNTWADQIDSAGLKIVNMHEKFGIYSTHYVMQLAVK
jgi:hypothetical protein